MTNKYSLKLINQFLFLVSIIFILSSCGKGDSPVQSLTTAITSFTPSSASVGDTVSIIGTNFSSTNSENIVNFNTTTIAKVISASSTLLKVIVPSGVAGTTGKISITINGQTISSGSNFTANKSVNQIILGKWTYGGSHTIDSFDIYTGYTNRYNTFTSSYMNQFNLTFLDTSKAFIFRNAFGSGVSGAFYHDSVPYKISGNNIYLSFPSGISGYADVTTKAYPSYVDTITIKSINDNTLIISQNYHYQHFWLYRGEYKQSIDTLSK